MNALWGTFCEQIKQSGYTVDDLYYCNEELFKSIVDEIGAYTPAQARSLQQEWRERIRKQTASNVSGNPPTSSADGSRYATTNLSHHFREIPLDSTPSSPAAKPAFTLEEVYQRAQHLLRDTSKNTAVPAGMDEMILIEHSSESLANFERKSQELFGPPQRHLLFKLCRAAALSRIERAARTGSSALLRGTDDTDALSTSAIVLYQDIAHTLGADLADIVSSGGALVACEVLVGRSRAVTDREAQNLNNFSMSQCSEMLTEAGYDSLSIQTHSAVAVYSEVQVLPRYVIRFDIVPSRSRQSPPRQPPSAVVVEPRGQAAKPHSSIFEASTTCLVHPGKEVEFWSPGEKRLLCSLCLYYDGYSQENCVPIVEATRAEAPRLERWVGNSLTFMKEINGVFDLFDAAADDIRTADETLESEVKQTFSKMRSRLDAMEKEMLREARSFSRQKEQDVMASREDVSSVVEEIQSLLNEIEEPLRIYRAGTVDMQVCVSILRSTQKAFGVWEPVTVAPYEKVDRNESRLRDLAQVLNSTFSLQTSAGSIELPETIDINYLKNDCDETK
ncbi:hypothetical protein AGDE_00851 [Angomonas deanei]|uniref:Uncharacterized protein n=1 Tax=Angomonas deanei TaxID=59799 RepID=A0A7G2CDZ7_9TRYP|nr:hypothetical protein AGDE_00851 [Angomonas deanei]CAD2218070.1 hypothetical protein, conserved [Angomonas deanei]|eukprot:EPY43072.1 hypothetical protein AGDE_00851 [Angomonas deanei]